ncbi:MAG TPA: ABC transporter permease, partial [Blastocatellia bacterium]|nr:ABC transporter permease [Blastocatellia bacterium]
MDSLLQDVRYSLRLMRKSPGFAIAAVATLALGMGANTVMFSVLNTVLLRPLPYPQADRLVRIVETDSRQGTTHDPVSPYNFLDWRNQSKSFVDMATYDTTSLVLTGQKAPARLGAIMVSASFFDVFQVAPFKGRTFLPDEDEPGKPRAAVIGYGAWQRHFGGDPEILGSSILLDDQSYTVVGIMPAGFGFPYEGVEVWCIPGFDLKQHGRAGHFLQAVGRLRPDVGFQNGQAEMNAIADALGATYNQPFAGVRLVPLQQEIVGDISRGLMVLWAAVVAVLLIACANVASLLLARAVSRQKEVAIRRALGGSRWRLIRQFLTESLLLATMGGALGVALAYWTGRLVVTASHGSVPRLRDFQIDGRVLLVAALACIVTGLAFGLAPALSALGVELNSGLKEGGAAGQSSDRLRLRSVFVVAEIALAMILLVGGGLLTKALWRLQHVDAGFQAEAVLNFRFSVP